MSSTTNRERAATLIWQAFRDLPQDEIAALVDRLVAADLLAEDRARPEGLTLLTLTLRHYMTNDGDELVGMTASQDIGWMDVVKVLETAKLLVSQKYAAREE